MRAKQLSEIVIIKISIKEDVGINSLSISAKENNDIQIGFSDSTKFFYDVKPRKSINLIY